MVYPAKLRDALMICVAVALFGTAVRPLRSEGAAVASEGSPAAAPAAAVDPISELQARLDAGEVVFRFDSVRGYLPSLLEALDIPVSSQTLVFSRTSLQTDRIAPWAPRALYFNDEVYVGWVQESPILEIASIHPVQGSFFYTLPQIPDSPPRFEREGTTCLMCHESRTMTGGVPGLLITSVLADRLGYPVTTLHEGNSLSDRPWELRWGGWYVTGTHAGMEHAGNARSPDLTAEIRARPRYRDNIDLSGEGNVLSLGGRFDVEPYLSPHSDLAALLVLTHQVEVHNLLSLVRDEGARGLGAASYQKGGGRAPGGGASIRAIDRLVRALLFADDLALPGPVEGTSAFAREFRDRGPFDRRGRTLRELDLETRLFRFPLSFLVYSEAFDALPEFAVDEIFAQLHDVLTVADAGDGFDHLSAADRAAVLEILLETKPRFRAWMESR